MCYITYADSADRTITGSHRSDQSVTINTLIPQRRLIVAGISSNKMTTEGSGLNIRDVCKLQKATIVRYANLIIILSPSYLQKVNYYVKYHI